VEPWPHASSKNLESGLKAHQRSSSPSRKLWLQQPFTTSQVHSAHIGEKYDTPFGNKDEEDKKVKVSKILGRVRNRFRPRAGRATLWIRNTTHERDTHAIKPGIEIEDLRVLVT
jgi:hypothetical protein